MGVVPLIRRQSGGEQDNGVRQQRESEEEYSQERGWEVGLSILTRENLKRQGASEMEKEREIDKEQNNSNSQLSTKSPWLSGERTNLLFIPHVLPT